MNEEIVLQACNHMRGTHDPGHPRHDFWMTLASLLEREVLVARTVRAPVSYDIVKIAEAYMTSITQKELK